MTRTLTYLSITLLGALSFTATAYAGCKPACKKGEQCRYEAAGGKFYCEALKSSKLSPAGASTAGPKRSPGVKTMPSKTTR